MFTPCNLRARGRAMSSALAQAVRGFMAARGGGVAVAVALGLPAVAGVTAGAVDYMAVSQSRTRLQNVIDSAAIAVAREMTLAALTPERVQALAATYVAANLPANTPHPITATAKLVENGMAVQVDGAQLLETPFGIIARFTGLSSLAVSATARVTAASTPQKTCIVSLGEKDTGGIFMHNMAQMTAPGCLLQSNSTQPQAVFLSQGSTITAQLVCARGGIKNLASKVDGTLMTDCQALPDPLATKPEPSPPAACTANALKITTGKKTLDPGVYCGGIQISKTASVTLNPGVYWIKDGPLRVDSSAELRGNGVTFMFAGRKAYFRFLDSALIEISAPSSGITAGMLLWESNKFQPGLAAWWNGGCSGGISEDDDIGIGVVCGGNKNPGWTKKINEHHINSDRARTLTGTIYLKKGLLLIDSTRPIADLSPYTVMVVQKLDLFDGPSLVLNSNYSGSTVPVPAGLGPVGGSQVRLGY